MTAEPAMHAIIGKILKAIAQGKLSPNATNQQAFDAGILTSKDVSVILRWARSIS